MKKTLAKGEQDEGFKNQRRKRSRKKNFYQYIREKNLKPQLSNFYYVRDELPRRNQPE